MTTEVSNLAPLAGESQVEHYQRVFPLTKGTTEERNAAVLDSWDQSEEAGELDQAANKKFPVEKFARVARVPVFTEHKTDRHSWDKDRLAALTDQMNHRILDTGSFSPLTDGHTPDAEAVQKGVPQPKVLGYQGKFRLGLIGNREPRWTVFADEYHHVGEAEKLARMTRRSPEVWVSAEKPFYDPCAALGAETPRLDMGTISYSHGRYWTSAGNDGAQVEKYSMTAAAFTSAMDTSVQTDKYAEGQPEGGDDQISTLVNAVIEGLQSSPIFQGIQQLIELLPQLQDLALSQELPPDDDDAAPAAQAAIPAQAPPADAEPVAKTSTDAPPAAEAQPDGDETPAPAPVAEQPPAAAPAPVALSDDDTAMMHKYMAKQISEADLKNYRDGKAAKPTDTALTAEHYQLKAEMSDLQRKRDQLAAEVAEQEVKARQAQRYSRLEGLRDQGFEFELADELSLTGEFSDTQFDTHCSKVVTKYARLPVGQRHFPVMEGDALPSFAGGLEKVDKAVMDAATKYALAEVEKGNKVDFRKAVEHIKAQAVPTSTNVK